MDDFARKKLNNYINDVLRFNGYDRPIDPTSTYSINASFDIKPSAEESLIKARTEKFPIFKMINSRFVNQKQGKKIGLAVTEDVGSRTKTSDGERREPTDPTGVSQGGYDCVQTNFDTALSYNKLDEWSHFSNFKSIISGLLLESAARTAIKVGFNGTHVAETSDRKAYPLLQDLNIGWLQKLREEAPERVFDGSTGTKVDGQIGFGSSANADYTTLDSLVFDAAHTLLDQDVTQDTEVVAFISKNLLHQKYFDIVNENNPPSEIKALDTVLLSRTVGTFKAVVVPFFPPGSVLITKPKNLSIYSQRGARRRRFIDEASRDRVAHYESSNDAYVIEDNSYACLIENIKILKD